MICYHALPRAYHAPNQRRAKDYRCMSMVDVVRVVDVVDVVANQPKGVETIFFCQSQLTTRSTGPSL